MSETRIPSTATTVRPAYMCLGVDDADKTYTKWSKTTPPSVIGDRVEITMNRLGFGIVVGYQVVDRWLGIWVRLENPPKWWTDQNARKGRTDFYGCALVFGAEIR